MGDSYFDRLVRSVEDEDHGVFVGRDEGRLLLGEFRGERFDPPLLFDFAEEELDVPFARPDGTARRCGRRFRSRRAASVSSSCISTRAS